MLDALGTLLLLLAAVWFARKIWRGFSGKQPQGEQRDYAAPAWALSTKPEFYLARWRVTYVNFEGEISERTVRITKVMPKLEQLGAWCELRKARRTFKFAGFRQITDAKTQQPVDLREWLAAQKVDRARKRAARNA